MTSRWKINRIENLQAKGSVYVYRRNGAESKNASRKVQVTARRAVDLFVMAAVSSHFQK